MSVHERMRLKKTAAYLEVWGERIDGRLVLVGERETIAECDRLVRENADAFRSIAIFRVEMVSIEGGLKHPEGERAQEAAT
jgi:hypothetical protein